MSKSDSNRTDELDAISGGDDTNPELAIAVETDVEIDAAIEEEPDDTVFEMDVSEVTGGLEPCDTSAEGPLFAGVDDDDDDDDMAATVVEMPAFRLEPQDTEEGTPSGDGPSKSSSS